MKLVAETPTPEMIEAFNDAKGNFCEHAESFWQAMYFAAPEIQQEPVKHEFQDREGTWHPFIDQRHYENTINDGAWPIRALYAFPPDAQAEIAKRDERIASLIAAGAEYQRQFFEQSDQIKELDQANEHHRELSRISRDNELKANIAANELSEDRDTWKARTEFSFQQRDELAAQNQQLREALNNQNFWVAGALTCKDWQWDGDQRESAEGCLAYAKEVLSLPDLASTVLNRVKAEALREAAKWFNDHVDNRIDTWQAEELRRMADAIEKGNP